MKPGKILSISQPPNVTLDENTAMTTTDWYCSWLYCGNHRVLFVPENYEWDGASIPRPAWSIIGLAPFGILDAPSLAHDALYRGKGGRKDMMGCTITNGNGNTVQIDRDEADWIFIKAMRYYKVKGIRDEVAYGIVRAFGQLYWGKPAPRR